MLYDSGQLKLKEPRELSNKERYQLAKEDYDYLFTKASNFYELFEFSFKKGNYSEAAFLLHQVTERLYNTLEFFQTLIFTTHNCRFLQLN